ncbi:MAG: phenylalanine--tRNA ligase subunit alpha [Candidatus Dasytiphilus stammeri]
MLHHIKELISQLQKNIENIKKLSTLEKIRVEYLGKQGILTLYMKNLREINPEDRPAVGIVLNRAKKQLLEALHSKKILLEKEILSARILQENLDVSLPGRGMKNGGLHPVTSTIDRIEKFFYGLGFEVVTGPEIEDSYHNFDALNIPINHPARTDHDTFWLNDNLLLRTQTSGVQIRTLKNQCPPIRMITSGKVYRKDYDSTHTPMFHQMECLMVDKKVSFTHLKNTLYNFLQNFFEEEDLKIRFRASYFPFTEPSAEVDVKIQGKKWLEILGCGMVHPKVLRHAGLDPDIYSGFAFGTGIERLIMLRYKIQDIRIFYDNDLRFLKQFK